MNTGHITIEFRTATCVLKTTGALFVVVMAAFAPSVASAQDLYARYHDLLYSTLAQPNTTIQLLSGPNPDYMNRGATGQQWLAEGFGYQFKITVEDGTGVAVQAVASTLQALPEPYFRAYEAVSEPDEDGVAVYFDLDGAWAHGGQDYLNFVPDSIVHATVVAHEAGHCMEQLATQNDPTIPTQWQAAIASDPVSVSAYGDGSWWEDIAEFSVMYALCMDGGSSYLAELRTLSPKRFDLWESILGIQTVVIEDIEGDLDHDGFVGIADLNLVLGNWNSLVRDGHPSDPSGDNYVGIADLNVVLGNWNAGAPSVNNVAIPEPAGSVVLSLGSLSFMRRRMAARHPDNTRW